MLQEQLKDYISQHPDFVVTPVRPVLTKKEKQIQERIAGKPVKPPNSAYSLFSRMMLQSEDIKSIDVKDRLNYISKQWKLCSEEEKQEYKERADHVYFVLHKNCFVITCLLLFLVDGAIQTGFCFLFRIIT